jgi:hypothetical protein
LVICGGLAILAAPAVGYGDECLKIGFGGANNVLMAQSD